MSTWQPLQLLLVEQGLAQQRSLELHLGRAISSCLEVLISLNSSRKYQNFFSGKTIEKLEPKVPITSAFPVAAFELPLEQLGRLRALGEYE